MDQSDMDYLQVEFEFYIYPAANLRADKVSMLSP